ncbi:MAG TPA: signal peptidase I [Oscillospiraceae bacterium]|nr:signal peptidase I [Oscillospiraceae bacterium]
MRRAESTTYKFISEKQTATELKTGNKSFKEKLMDFNLYDFTDSVIYALIAIAVIFVLFLRVFSIEGVSMTPTLHDKDKVVVASTGSKYEKGDIVVIGKTRFFSESLVKRVIAVGGDNVYINFSTGKVYVNEIELVEYYVNSPTERQYDIAFPITVPEGAVFLLGDNRNDSLDSRSSLIGCVDERSVVGRVLFKLSFTGWKVK